MFRPRLKIPYRSKVIVETVTEGNFSTHFLSDYGSWITSHQRLFYPKFYFEMIDLVILEEYLQAKFKSNMLDFHFYPPRSTHNWNSYFGYLGGTYLKDNNSRDFYRRNTKLIFKFKLQMCTFKNIQAASKSSIPFKSYC